MAIYKIKKPDKEEAEKTFVGNCAGKIFLSNVGTRRFWVELIGHAHINYNFHIFIASDTQQKTMPLNHRETMLFEGIPRVDSEDLLWPAFF